MNIIRNRFFHIALGAILLIAIIVFYCVNFLMDLWWFDTLGYVYYYGLRETYKNILTIGITVIIALLVYVNFRIIPRLMSNHLPDTASNNQEKKTGWLNKLFTVYSIKLLLPLSVLITIPVIFPIYENWEIFLLYIFSSPSGVVDPVYAKDISFYLFSYPCLLPPKVDAAILRLTVLAPKISGTGLGLILGNVPYLLLKIKSESLSIFSESFLDICKPRA